MNLSPRRPRHSGAQFLRAYLRHSWRGVVVVAAVVFIAHHYHWLDPIDTYAFFVISHFLGDPPRRDVPPKVVVASIDQVSYETDYGERSPLDRCKLRDHLAAIYTAKPSLVVVDVDLSPLRPPTPRRQTAKETKNDEAADCQGELERLIVSEVKKGTGTVLMKPFGAAADTAKAEQQNWQGCMEKQGVRFGDASLPSSWGVTIHHYCAPTSLAVMAHYATLPASSTGPKRPCESDGAKKKKSFVDPSHYLNDIAVVQTAPMGRLKFEDRIAVALDSIPPSRNGRHRVVFFGGGWGESDTYLTPVGELYGVEVHAAAYLSMDDRLREAREVFEALADLLFAFLVGLAFTFCWGKYFSEAFARSPATRQHAVVWLVVLGSLILASVCGLVFGSWLLLRWGLWLSPIPLIVGMSIDTFVESLREAAVTARGDAPAAGTLPEPSRVFEYFRRDTLGPTGTHTVVEAIEDTTWVAPGEAPAPNRAGWWSCVRTYFWGDASDLYRSDEPHGRSAAGVLFLERIAGLIVTVYGLWLLLAF